MNPLGLPDYVSDATQFIESLKRSKPALEAEQRAGRALLWDKTIDHTQWKEFDEAETPRKSYFYQTNPIEEAQK